MLGFNFNPVKQYVLLVLPEVEDEVRRQRRLKELYPWFDEAALVKERGANMPKLSRAEQQKIKHGRKFLLDYVGRNTARFVVKQRSPPGETDCQVLAVAMEKAWCVATDDESIHLLGKEFEVRCFYGFDVLHKLLSASMLTKETIIEIFEALEGNNDLPARWVESKETLFKKVFATPGTSKAV